MRDPGEQRDAGRRRRGPFLIGAGILTVITVSALGALGLGGGGAGAGETGRERAGQTVRVGRGTLIEQTAIDGQLGHGPEVPFQIKAEGTVTWLPAPDKTVRRGGAVLRVDERPVVLLYGRLPMYRELGLAQPEEQAAESPQQEPAPLRGMDVKQFETNLSALGYSGFTVDDTYSELTARAVKLWQQDLGLPRTGRIGAGDIVYAPGAVRIAGSSVRIGAAAAGNPLTYTSTKRMVTVNAPATETHWAKRGREVSVELPDGRKVTGKVASLSKDASAAPAEGSAEESGGEGEDAKSATVAVVITFGDQGSLGRLESGPVTVRYVVKERKDVLTVPVAALVSLAEGGYGIEPAAGGRFIPVETGLFADGEVELSGSGVREGMKVRIPE